MEPSCPALSLSLPGIVDFASIERAQKLHPAWAHAGGNLVFLAMTAINYSWRQPNAAADPGPSGLVLTLVGLVLMLVTGWLGGEMSFRHGIGVAEEINPPDDDHRLRD